MAPQGLPPTDPQVSATRSKTKARDNCLSNTNGNWRASPEEGALQMLKNDEPFAWIRWGDGEILDVARGRAFGDRLKSVLHNRPRTYLCIATWRFCNKMLRTKWNQATRNNTVVYDTVYLPMGDPMETPRPFGWAAKARVSNNIIAVVPPHLRGIPFFANATIIDSPKAKTVLAVDTTIQLIEPHLVRPAIVFVAAGASAKIIVYEMFQRFPTSTFVDIGSVLDGYAGVHSRDYNDPTRYCNTVERHDRHLWFSPGVCQS